MAFFRRIVRLRRLVLFARVLLLGTVAMYVASLFSKRPHFDILNHPFMADFVAHWTGGVLAGRPDLYSIAAQTTVERAVLNEPGFTDLFLSPPYVAWLYWPLGRLPLQYAVVVWAVVMTTCFVLIYKILRTDIAEPKRYQRRLFILFALAFQPVIEIVTAGQDTCLTGLFWAIGIHYALRKKDFPSGLAFGLGAIKPQLFVLPFLYLALRRRWKAIAGMVVTGGAWVGLGLFVGGVESFRSWLGILQSREYLELTRQGRIWKMSSIVAMFEGLFPPSLDEAARVVGNLVAVVIGILTLRAAYRMRDERRVWALLVVATVICSPHLFSYDLGLLVIAALLLLPERWPRSTVSAVLVINLLIWLSPLRAGASNYAWPISIAAMTLTPVALLYLWRDLRRDAVLHPQRG